MMGQGTSFCLQELPFRIQSRAVSGQFSAHLWTSITAGFILAFPYILLEFWKFISLGYWRTSDEMHVDSSLWLLSYSFWVYSLAIT